MMNDTALEGSSTARHSPLDRALSLANSAIAALLLGVYLIFLLALLFGKERTNLETGTIVTVALLPASAAFAFAGHQFRRHARARWLAQVLTLVSLVLSFAMLVLLYEQAVMSTCDTNHGVCL